MSSHVIISFSDLPSVVITGGTSVKTVSVGKNLTLECIANGTPQPEKGKSAVLKRRTADFSARAACLWWCI